MKENEVICILCPQACRIKVTVDDNGEVAMVNGYSCDRGKDYAIQEIKDPRRILTTTVRTTSKTHPLLSVKTNKPIPKKLLGKAMNVIAHIEVKPPIKIGEVILPNILDTGSDVIATQELK